MKKISELEGKKIYDDQAKFLGEISDVIINLESGSVEKVTLSPISDLSSAMSKEWFAQNTIGYDKVVSFKDIVVVSNRKRAAPIVEEKTAVQPTGPKYPFKRW